MEIRGQSIQVCAYEAGSSDSPDLLVLHGWGSSSALMGSLTSRLSNDFHVVAFDFPGSGASPEPPVALSVEDQVQIVLQVAASFAMTSFGIVGHSNGGRVALELSSRSESGVEPTFLALVSPSGIRRKRTASFYLKSWTARVMKAPFMILPSAPREFCLDWLRHSLVWKLLGSSDYQALDGVMRETFVLTVNHYLDDVLPSVSCPVLLIRGTDDDAITAEQIQKMAGLLPDAGVFEIDGAGHYAHIDQPGVVLNAIRELAAE